MADQPRITPREFQYRKKFFTDLKKVPKQKLICLACGDRLSLEKGKVFYHKKLGVLLCKECKGKQNAYALTDSCIICNKMAVYICGDDNCKNEFCKRCLHRGNPDSVEAAESDGWKCFECLPNPIWEHRAICALVMKSTPKEKSANEESDSADERPKPKSKYRGMTYVAREKLKKTKDLTKSLRKLVDTESDEGGRARPMDLYENLSSSEEKTVRTTRKNFVKVNGKANGTAEPPSQSGSHKSQKKKVTFVPGSQKEHQESDTESEGRLLKKEPITKDHSLLFKKHLSKVSEDARELYSTFKTEMENLKRRYSKTELKNMNDVVKIVTKFNSTLNKFRDSTENEQEKLFHSYKSFCKVAGKKAVPIKKQKPVLLLRKKKVVSSDEDENTDENDSDERTKRKKTLSPSSSEKEEVGNKRTAKNQKSALAKKALLSDSSDKSEEENESETEKIGNKKSALKNRNLSSSSSSEQKETKKDSSKKGVSKALNKTINSSRSMIESSSDAHAEKEKQGSSPAKESATKTKQIEKPKKKTPPRTTRKDVKTADPEIDGRSSAMEVSSMDSDVDSEAGKKQDDPKNVNENPDVDIHDADTDCEKAKAQIGARLSVRKDLLTPNLEIMKRETLTYNNDSDKTVVLSSDPLTPDEPVPETTKITEKDEAENERSGCKKVTDKGAETARRSESDTEKNESTDSETAGKKAADKDGKKTKGTRNAKVIMDSNSNAEEDNTTKAEDERRKAAEKKKKATKSTSESSDDEAEKDSTVEEEEKAKKSLLESSDSEAETEDTTNSEASRKKAVEEEEKAKKALLESSDSEAEEGGTTNSEGGHKKAVDIRKTKVKKSLFGVSDAEKEPGNSAHSEEVAKKVTDEEEERAKKALLDSSCSETENEDTTKSETANKKGSDALEKVADKEEERTKKAHLESSGSETDNEGTIKSKAAEKQVADLEEERAKKTLLESSDSEAETTIQSKSSEKEIHSDSTVVMGNGLEQLKEKNEGTGKKADKISELAKQGEKKSSKRDSDGSGSEKENQNNEQETQKKRKIVDASSEDDLKKTRDKKRRTIFKDDSSSGEKEDQDDRLVRDRMEDTSDEEERAKKDLLASSSSGSDESDSENKKPNTRKGNRNLNLRQNTEKKFKVKNNRYYRADIKLRMKCSVVLKRLQKKQLKEKRHRLALQRSAKRVNENRLKSLLSLENLEKNKQKNKTKESESDGSDSEMLTRKQKRLKLAEEKDSLLNHLNKTNDCSVNKDESDSSTSTSLSKAKIDNDKIFSKDELFDMANERAKRKLLESDDDTEIFDLTENSEEKEKEDKKKGSKKKSINEKGNESEDDKEKKKDSESEDDSTKQKNEKSKWKNDKLLKGKIIDSSDSDNEKKMEKLEDKLEKAKLDKDNSDSETGSSPMKTKMKKKKVRQRRVLDSDSDGKKQASSDDESSTSSLEIIEENIDVPKRKKKRAAKSSDSSDSEPRPKTKRRRIKKVSSESNSSDEDALSSQNSSLKGRKNIRKVIKDKHIADDTKQAALEEEERLKRIADRQKLYNEMYESRLAGEAKVEKLVLDFDEETKEEVLRVDDELVKKLKPHQAKGIKFMWDACFESLERTKSTKGSGCIIAHCMGLGKTFQVVTLVHTLLNCDETGIKSVMIVCPLSTVLNWKNEFRMWLKNAKNGDDIEIFELTKLKKNQERKYMLEHWQRQGGVLIIGYEMYRNLTSAGKKMRKRDLESIMATLVDPGPDLVVCDEGHLLKNEQSALSQAMRRVRTSRRIVLTGTPLQNNLIEYHCMVQFVKPNLLGTKKEFLNRFVNPITNGQYEDSTQYDVKLMKKRAHVLHKMLEGSVQRFDYSVLTPFLPPKQEYVIFVHLTEVQKKMYQHYLENFARRHKGAGGSLFADFQALQRIWTHPKVMKYNDEKEEARREKARLDDSEGSLKDFIDDGSASESSENSDSGSVQSINSGSDKEVAPARRRTRANATASDLEPEPAPESQEPAWWEQFVKEEDFDDMRISVKLLLLFAILKECEQIGDKLLVFSQSLYSLSLIEEFLAKIDESTQDSQELDTLDKHTGSWSLGQDYFRLDGQTSAENRSIWCKNFNRETNTRARLFLISTRAGGLGINLTAANRVVIFDASWNPSHDVQSIFRIYRFGQKKPCYIYRFLAAGTMEEKIYKRQVAKLSLACRVVDEQQIERHYSGHNLAELYSFDDSEPEEKTLNCPKDRLLAEIFLKYPKAVKDYLEHDSLLENKEDEELDESERQQAWQEYEDEKKGKRPMNMMDMGMMGMMPEGVGGANNDFNLIYQMIQHDYPLASHQQIMTKVTQTINNMYQNFDNSHFLQNSIARPQYPIPNQNTTLLQQQLQQKQQREHQNYLQQLQYSQSYGNRVPNARFPGPSHQAAYKAPSATAPTRFNNDEDIEIIPAERTAASSSLLNDKGQEE